MGPGRPPNERDLVTFLNGSPQFLGIIVSASAATNNATTATPFANTPRGALTPGAVPLTNLAGTLAGKMLLVQTTSIGQILASTSATVTLVSQSTTPSFIPPVALPGPALALGERVIILMQPTEGWLQWLPTGGAGNLLVWELV